MDAHGSVRAPEAKQVITWAQERALRHGAFREKIKEIENSYELVFIPGILGSKLRIGDFVYGEDAIDSRKLVLSDSNRTARAEILDRFIIRRTGFEITKQDVYGEGLTQLQDAMGGKTPHEFPYDWRQDITQIAEEFHEYARKQLSGKRVIIVAHSMGGLVAWRWKNNHLKDRPFTLIALVLLGSPLRGSCEIAKTLVEGYSESDNASWYEKAVTQLVFKKSHAALFTFPSVFQLFPKEGDCQCIEHEHNGQVYTLNPFDLGTWDRQREYSVVRKFFGDSGLDKETYRQLIQRAIDAAKDFHSSFDLHPHDDRIYFLYAGKENMASQYVVKIDRDWLKVDRVVNTGFVQGDGRVSEESATLGNYQTVLGDNIFQYPLDETHGSLLKDPRFGKFVNRSIKNGLIQKRKALEILDFALQDNELREEIRQMHWVPSPLINSTALEADLGDAQARIAQFNLRTALPGSADPARDAVRRGIDLEKAPRTKISGKRKLAAALYESAWVYDPKSVSAETLYRLSAISSREGERLKATAILSKAVKIAERDNDLKLTGELHTKLAGLYKKTGLHHSASIVHGKVAEMQKSELTYEIYNHLNFACKITQPIKEILASYDETQDIPQVIFTNLKIIDKKFSVVKDILENCLEQQTQRFPFLHVHRSSFNPREVSMFSAKPIRFLANATKLSREIKITLDETSNAICLHRPTSRIGMERSVKPGEGLQVAEKVYGGLLSTVSSLKGFLGK